MFAWLRRLVGERVAARSNEEHEARAASTDVALGKLQRRSDAHQVQLDAAEVRIGDLQQDFQARHEGQHDSEELARLRVMADRVSARHVRVRDGG